MIRPRTTPDQSLHLFSSGRSVAEEVLTRFFGDRDYVIEEQINRPKAVVYIVGHRSNKIVLRLSCSPLYNVMNIAAAYREWDCLDIPVPTPKLSGTIDGIQYLLMDYIAGEPFSFVVSEAAQRKTAADAGRFLARMRDIRCEGFGYLDANGVGTLSSWSEYLDTHYPLIWIHENGYITQNEADLLRSLKIRSNYPDTESRLLHGDYKPKNMLIQSDGTISAVTDPQPIAGDPLRDFAMFNHFCYREQARQNRPFDDSHFTKLRKVFKDAYEAEMGRALQTEELRKVTSYEILQGFGKVEGLLEGKLDEAEGESNFMLMYLRQQIAEL